MSKKILIVEDDQDILAILQDVLSQEGFEVTGLNHTESIINSVAIYTPDLLMLDFLLAGINGGELCYEIKTNPGTARLPVILLSAYPRVIESLGNYGSDAFIAKPFDINDIISTVKLCLANDMVHA